MPRVRRSVTFEASGWNDDDEALLLELKKRHHDGNETGIIRYFERLSAWYDVQHPGDRKEWSRNDTYLRFLIHAFPNAGSTVKTVHRHFNAYRVDPSNIGPAVERVNHHYTSALVGKWSSERKTAKVATATLDELTPYFTRKIKKEVDVHYRALWFGLVATGNRVPCVAHAKDVRFSQDGESLIVVWAGRKVTKVETTCAYPLKHSCQPPEDIKEHLRTHRRFWPAIWPLKTSSVNSHMRRKKEELRLTGESITSRAPRVRMAQVLAPLVSTGDLSHEMYTLMMDHTVETGIRIYQRPMDDAESD